MGKITKNKTPPRLVKTVFVIEGKKGHNENQETTPDTIIVSQKLLTLPLA